VFDVRVQQYGRSDGAFQLFERELIEQARDRARTPRLAALGARLSDVGPDAEGMARLHQRFADDGRDHPRGSFTFLRFDLDPDLASELLPMPPSEIEDRLLKAAGEALRSLPQREGLYYVAWEKDAPEVRAVLSPRRADGATGRTLDRTDVQGLQAAWHARTHAAFHIRPRLEPSPERQALAERWRQVVGEVQKAIGARMRGEIDQDALRAVLERADSIRKEWQGHPALPSPQGETLAITIQNGREFLNPLGSSAQKEVLSEATARALGPGLDLAHVERPDGALKAVVRVPTLLGEEDREALAARLRKSLGDAAARHPDWDPREALGGVSVRSPNRERAWTVRLEFEDGQRILQRLGPLPPGREAREASLVARFEAALRPATTQVLSRAQVSLVPSYEFSFPPGGSIRALVRFEQGPGTLPLSRTREGDVKRELERDLPRLSQEVLKTQHGLRIPAGAIHAPASGRAPVSQRKLRKAERLGPGGDLHTVLFRVEGGIRYVSSLEIGKQQEIMARAAAKALPGLMDRGFRPDIAAQRQGDTLLVRVTVPHDYFVDRDLIPSAPAQARFANAVYRIGGESQSQDRGEVLPVRPGGAPKVTRPAAPARTAPDSAPREVFDRMSRLVPAALQTGRTILRWAGRLMPEED
jgi:hypothetical protein